MKVHFTLFAALLLAPLLRYMQGLPVDCTEVLATGERFRDIRKLKQLLLANLVQMTRTVAAKLVVYATGAPISFADRAEIERIVAQTRAKDHGFRSLIHAVTESPLFQSR